MAIAPCKLLKLMPWRLRVAVCGCDGLLPALCRFSFDGRRFSPPSCTFILCFRPAIWKPPVLTLPEDSVCWCEGLESGEMVCRLFLGDGFPIKWEDEADDSGEGPPALIGLCESGLLLFVIRSFKPPQLLWLLSWPSLLMIEVVGEVAEPINGKPWIETKKKKVWLVPNEMIGFCSRKKLTWKTTT